jgi:hypothetical protein
LNDLLRVKKESVWTRSFFGPQLVRIRAMITVRLQRIFDPVRFIYLLS